MAQPKVNDYFLTRKKRDSQAAKRRKIETGLPSSDSAVSKDQLTLPSSNTDTKIQENVSNLEPPKQSHEMFNEASKIESCSARLRSSNVSLSESRPGLRSKSKTSHSQSSQPRSSRSKHKHKGSGSSSPGFDFKSQKKITDLIEIKFPITTDKPQSRTIPSEKAEEQNNAIESLVGEDKTSELPSDSKDMLISEEATSFEDSHWGARDISTPRKRNLETETDTGPTTRKCKVPHRKLTTSETNLSKSAKKKLELGALQESTPNTSLIAHQDLQAEVTAVGDSKETETENQTDKKFLIRLVSEVESPDVPVSPLALTPERSPETDITAPEMQDKTPQVEPCSPKLKNLSQKLKGLSKMNGKALKNRLKQNGKLEDVKQKLDSLQKAVKKSDAAKAGKDEVDGDISIDKETSKEKEVLPAYQRFEYLAKKGTPLLTLPFSYKTLEGTFQAMDSVVSMLHNRSELCTYSKLKAAVQNYTKKNFEEKAVGQIKTVVPDAYIFRQEKNVCIKENKKGYSLTVEADLSKDVTSNPEEKVSRTPEGKPVFSASALINRKQYFHSNLLGLVMKHHKTFLASLNPPLSIPDSKITRWHPKFQLDQVPDIVPSPLPQPPEVLVYHSAKDVLNAQKGRLNPRVEAALAKVVEDNKKTAALSAVPTATKSQGSSSSTSSSATSPSMKGIPPALLAKIRAKEALKIEAALTRDPAEDNKTKMMGHLPEMIRILRSYFITEKKPALPLEAIYKKLGDSYRSGISRKDVEQHVKLMTELVPELVSIVEIKRGAFLKLDRNVDAQVVANKIMNMVKTRK